MTFMVETPHSNTECLRSLDAQLDTGPQIFNKFYYGCKAGDHTGYALVDARDEGEVRELIPEFLRGKSKVVKVEPFSIEDVKTAHTGQETPLE